MELTSLESGGESGGYSRRQSGMNTEGNFYEDNRRDSLMMGDSVKQIMALTEQIHNLEDENDFLTTENAQLKEKIRSLEASLNDRSDEVEELKGYVDELISQLTATRTDVATFRSETDRFKVERLARGIHGSPTGDDNKHIEEETTNQPVAPKREKQNLKTSQAAVAQLKTSTLPNRNYHHTNKDNADALSQEEGESVEMRLNSPEAALAIASDFELRRIKRQLASLLKQMENNDTNMTKLEKENLELKKKLKTMNRSKEVVDCGDSRSKVELLHVIRCSIEEKVKWQTYAERLIKRILLQSPGILDVTATSPVDLSDTSSGELRPEGRWEGFALSLVQKVMQSAPYLLDNMTIPEKLSKHHHEENVDFV